MELKPMATLPETGFLRLTQIVGDPKAYPPTPALIPVSRSTWWPGSNPAATPDRSNSARASPLGGWKISAASSGTPPCEVYRWNGSK